MIRNGKMRVNGRDLLEEREEWKATEERIEIGFQDKNR